MSGEIEIYLPFELVYLYTVADILSRLPRDLGVADKQVA